MCNFMKQYFDRLIKNKFMSKGGDFKSGIYQLSPKDNRDFLDVAIVPMDFMGDYPSDYIIENKQYPIYNQGQYGMCVAFAAKRVMEHMEAKEHRQYTPMSAGFIYRNRKTGDLMHMFNTNGMVAREALNHLVSDGVCAESIYSWMGNWQDLSPEEKKKPLDDTLFPLAYYKFDRYFKLTSDEGIMSHLTLNKTGVMITIPVTNKFKGGINELVHIDWALDNVVGYHEMVIEGWKTIDGVKYWIVANSWGDWWGDKGYCYLPFGYAMSEMYATFNEENNPSYYHVQVGAFADKENAKDLRDKLVSWGYPTYLVSIWNNEYQKVLHKVQVGAYYYRQNADIMKEKINNDTRIQALNVGSWIVQY